MNAKVKLICPYCAKTIGVNEKLFKISKGKLIIIDKEYNLYQVNEMTPHIVSLIQKGEISLINTDTLEGLNIDFTWSRINEWEENK